jgi:hypothetical protein
LRLQAALGKKEVRTTKEKEKTIYAKVKKQHHDKIYANSKGSAKQQRTAFEEVKEEVKVY